MTRKTHSLRCFGRQSILTAVLGIGLLAAAGVGSATADTCGHSSRQQGEPILSGFSRPTALAFDLRGNLYMVEMGANRIILCRPDGERVVLAEGLAAPSGLAVDRNGNIFVSTADDGSIWHITPRGEQKRLTTGLNRPGALTLDRDGSLWVVCMNDGSIRRIGRLP